MDLISVLVGVGLASAGYFLGVAQPWSRSMKLSNVNSTELINAQVVTPSFPSEDLSKDSRTECLQSWEYEMTIRAVSSVDASKVVTKTVGLRCPNCKAVSKPAIEHGELRVCPSCGLKIQLWGAGLHCLLPPKEEDKEKDSEKDMMDEIFKAMDDSFDGEQPPREGLNNASN